MENMEFSNNNTYFTPPEVAKKMKRDIPIDKKDGVFALLFFASVFVFIDFGVMHGFNFGFTLSFYALFAVFTAYLWKREVKVSAFSYLCGILSLAGAATFTLSRDIFVNFIMVFLVAALFTIYVFGISGSFKFKEGSAKMLAEILYGTGISPFSHIADVTRSVGKTTSKNKNMLYALIGVALAIPALLVIIPLLVNGDAAFRGLIAMIGRNIGQYLGEAFLALIFAPYVFSYAFSRKNKLDKDNENNTKAHRSFRFAPNAVSVSFLCVISFTYIVYLFSQLAYFFSAFSGILPEGYEHSASVYAREGFFEMFAISVINIALISAVNIFTKRENGGKPSAVLKAVECFISLFSVLILITAMSKMVLNIEVFGLSKYRLLVSLLMVMLAVIIAFFVLHIFRPKISYMQPIIIICSVLFIAFSFADMDNLVARYNVNAYANERIETLDLDYMMYDLSDSAVPYIIAVANGSNDGVNAELAQQAKQHLFNMIRYYKSDELILTENDVLEYKPNSDFREFNITTRTAGIMLADYFNSLPEEEREEFINPSDFSISQDDYEAEGERKIGMCVEIQSEDVYALNFEYYIDRKHLGGMQVSGNPQLSVPFGFWEICYPDLYEDFFTHPNDPECGILGITVSVVLENGETIPIKNIYEWDAYYGRTYYFTLRGSVSEGFFLATGIPGTEDFDCLITSWDLLPDDFFPVS